MAGSGPADPLSVAAEVARAFEACGVRYVVGGSLASTAFGEPRATMDVDFAADLRLEDLPGFTARLAAQYFLDAEWMARELLRHGSFQLVHRASMVRVDVFLPEWTGFHLWKWERRRRLSLLPGTEMDVTGPEGIVIQKLAWFRAGGEVSDAQWRDVVGVLKLRGGALAFDELRSWSRHVGVVDLLDRALGEAGVVGE